MTARQVAETLKRALGRAVEMTPHGFDLDGETRLECGSGIAGNGGAWSAVAIKSGKLIAGPFKTTGPLHLWAQSWGAIKKHLAETCRPCACCEVLTEIAQMEKCHGCKQLICDRDTCVASPVTSAHKAWNHRACDKCGEAIMSDPGERVCQRCQDE